VVTPCYKPVVRVAQSLCRQLQETSRFSRLALRAPAEIEVDRTHIEESSAGEKQDVEPPRKETVEVKVREGAERIKSKQRERPGKR